MNLPWGDEKSNVFLTNVGLVTSDGPNGPNVMSVEWTHHISHEPGLIAICIGPKSATAENIIETKEFGVNLAATDQNVLCSIAGRSSGHDVDKIKVLEELGVKFTKANSIKTNMIEGVAMQAACKLVEVVDWGDLKMFVGEVLEASANKEKEPLIYHKGKYWKVGEMIEKPPKDELEGTQKLVEKYRKE